MTFSVQGYYILLSAIVLVAFLALTSAEVKSVTFGRVEKGAKSLFSTEVSEARKRKQVLVRKIHFGAQEKAIGAIVIVDLAQKNGGTASLLEGGPRLNFALILLTSKRGFGLNFTIQIYDIPKSPKNCVHIDLGGAAKLFG